MVFWDNTNYASFELAAQGEDGLAVVSVMYEVRNGLSVVGVIRQAV